MFKKEKKVSVKKIAEKKEVSRKDLDTDHIEITFDDGSVEIKLV